MSGSGIINITSGLKSVEGEKAIYSPTAEGDSPSPLIICASVCVCVVNVCLHVHFSVHGGMYVCIFNHTYAHVCMMFACKSMCASSPVEEMCVSV